MKNLINNLFLVFTLLLTISIKAQTKAETENWIQEKVKSYPVGNFYIRELKIQNGYIEYFETINNTKFYERILIKNIKEVKVSKRYDSNWGNYYSIKLFCKSKGCNDSGQLINGNYKNTVIEYLENYGSIEIVMNENFKENDNSSRMQKAILHLIKLYGGNAIVKKEAF